jgi:hypothetical protein
MTLIAKPIVKNQLWVITDGVKKVGNIEANSNATSFSVKIGDHVNYFSSTKKIEQDIHLVFEQPFKSTPVTEVPFAHWPTDGKTYNNFYDVKHKFHVYTKTPDSKCYYVAGYFNIELNGDWQTIFCPKYIFVQRYPNTGPFTSAEEARELLST